MVEKAESLANLNNWHGGFPGAHEFSTMDQLQEEALNPGIAMANTALKQLIEGWEGNRFLGLYLYGDPGRGKTHAAIGIARTLHDAVDAEIHYRHGPTIYAVDKDESSFKNISYRTISGWVAERYKTMATSGQSSVFPASYNYDEPCRNPRTVLVYDEYQPEQQEIFTAAVTAADQFGGLVIATSNHVDPFGLVKPQTPELKTEQEAFESELLKQVAPAAAEELEATRQQNAHEISESLRSRVVAGFEFIEFTGEDKRKPFFNL